MSRMIHIMCWRAGTRYNILARYRIPIVALLATSLALHMWAANVALNLTGEGHLIPGL